MNRLQHVRMALNVHALPFHGHLGDVGFRCRGRRRRTGVRILRRLGFSTPRGDRVRGLRRRWRLVFVLLAWRGRRGSRLGRWRFLGGNDWRANVGSRDNLLRSVVGALSGSGPCIVLH